MLAVMDKIDRTFNADQEFACWSSSSSDSIGKNSYDDEGGENEVESSYKGPLDMMQSLEEVLPIRRGISKFYKGKSKSFTSLLETASLPMKDLTKPENLYSRRRRNLLSNRICSRGGISKKPVKSVLTVAVTAMSQREEDSSSSGDDCSPIPKQYRKNLTPRQRKGYFGNCVPVVDSPRCFQTAAGLVRIFLFVVIVNLIRSCLKLDFTMVLYIFIVFLGIVALMVFSMLLFSVTNKGTGRVVYGQGFRDYWTVAFSTWLNGFVDGKRSVGKSQCGNCYKSSFIRKSLLE